MWIFWEVDFWIRFRIQYFRLVRQRIHVHVSLRRRLGYFTLFYVEVDLESRGASDHFIDRLLEHPVVPQRWVTNNQQPTKTQAVSLTSCLS